MPISITKVEIAVAVFGFHKEIYSVAFKEAPAASVNLDDVIAEASLTEPGQYLYMNTAGGVTGIKPYATANCPADIVFIEHSGTTTGQNSDKSQSVNHITRAQAFAALNAGGRLAATDGGGSWRVAGEANYYVPYAHQPLMLVFWERITYLNGSTEIETTGEGVEIILDIDNPYICDADSTITIGGTNIDKSGEITIADNTVTGLAIGFKLWGSADANRVFANPVAGIASARGFNAKLRQVLASGASTIFNISNTAWSSDIYDVTSLFYYDGGTVTAYALSVSDTVPFREYYPCACTVINCVADGFVCTYDLGGGNFTGSAILSLIDYSRYPTLVASEYTMDTFDQSDFTNPGTVSITALRRGIAVFDTPGSGRYVTIPFRIVNGTESAFVLDTTDTKATVANAVVVKKFITGTWSDGETSAGVEIIKAPVAYTSVAAGATAYVNVQIDLGVEGLIALLGTSLTAPHRIPVTMLLKDSGSVASLTCTIYLYLNAGTLLSTARYNHVVNNNLITSSTFDIKMNLYLNNDFAIAESGVDDFNPVYGWNNATLYTVRPHRGIYRMAGVSRETGFVIVSYTLSTQYFAIEYSDIVYLMIMAENGQALSPYILSAFTIAYVTDAGVVMVAYSPTNVDGIVSSVAQVSVST
jgi:hypothetical protein